MVADVVVPISIGELVDKLTILELKRDRIQDAGKRAEVLEELGALERIFAPILAAAPPEAAEMVGRLRAVNGTLWTIEDDIRDCERRQDFGADFVRLARSVYITNDERAALKRSLSLLLGSRFAEVKSYAPYA
ncbi:hypothetical protein IBL26_25260 [Roseomonas aerophila]|uniref:Uncharacterized protein n=1 Tax=Teichococcus aerophilus TaxID=1224513 RepID=A0ABR7RV14_9PROT|nr:hypothetical protein [Pseudoroseomonas aerophila]MBC9210153.1 hypothetical protein [Pseudoroseomonas aerophila]